NSGASIVASSWPSFTSEPTSAYTFLTKLLTLAYRSTCWKAISSPGTYKLVDNLPFSRTNVAGPDFALSGVRAPPLSRCPAVVLPASSFFSPGLEQAVHSPDDRIAAASIATNDRQLRMRFI